MRASKVSSLRFPRRPPAHFVGVESQKRSAFERRERAEPNALSQMVLHGRGLPRERYTTRITVVR